MVSDTFCSYNQLIFSLISKAQNETHPDALIAYVGRGMLASIMDAKPVMELISSRVMNNSYSVVINCYALIDETKPILYETSFLQEIAAMNFKKFKVPMPPANKIRVLCFSLI